MVQALARLASTGGPRGAVSIRVARAEEFPRILAIARSTFTQPRWLFEHPGNRCHYSRDWCRPENHPHGRYRVTVACDAEDRLVAYCYAQFRHDGDVYVREIAANPPETGLKQRGAGAALMLDALSGSEVSGESRVVARVIREHRQRQVPAQSLWRDPLPYYDRLGFRTIPDTASLGDGYRIRPGDTWVAGRVGLVRAALLDVASVSMRVRA